MLKVGLTGGIATGKSHVLSILEELGCEVLDADDLAHAAIAPGEPAYSEIVDAFGEKRPRVRWHYRPRQSWPNRFR